MNEDQECGKPCPPENPCDECDGYWLRMKEQGYWKDGYWGEGRGWTDKGWKEMTK